jgi:serine/threonine protein phosphatase PrpC
MLMRAAAVLKAAGATHPGRQRTVNEDRLHVDAARGLFVVVDGVGGQAAGGKAADVALNAIRGRLERETGPIPSRIREALTIANNEICRLGATRREWSGMACVATVLVVDGAQAIVGHVGDTRLYRISPAGIEKITHDHSPVGEREDAGELSEREAMRHSRRNEVYRDLGSDPHEPEDQEFIDISEVRFAPDAALLLCSDGLTDLVDSAAIEDVARRGAGNPERVVDTLIDAANRAGGKDNVTVIYIEGEQFAASAPTVGAPPPRAIDRRPSRFARVVRVTLLVMLTLLLTVSIDKLPTPLTLEPSALPAGAARAGQLVVREGESISAALKRATAGDEVVVDPGEYREAVALPSHVRLVSRVSGGAILRLPASARETDAAAVASNVSGAALVGFRIVGDATTPLGTGLLVRNSDVSIINTEISGATKTAIDVIGRSTVNVMASDLHDNPGAALAVGSDASARITHNVFKRNGVSPHTPAAIIFGAETDLTLAANMFFDMTPAAFRTLSDPERAAIARDNWFAAGHPPRSSGSGRPRGSRP